MADPVELLTRLIAVDTHNPGGDEPRLCALVADELRARGGEVRVVEVPRDGQNDKQTGAYALATWGTPRLLINAHVDTVPVNAGWSADPFRARVAEGRVVGLGACDTKGAIASLLCALDAAPPRDLAIAFTGDEERTGTVIRALLERERDALAEARRAIVCEPTSCKAGTRHRGILWIEATIGGRGGHSSRADDEPAPLADAARLAVAFAEWGQQQRELGPIGFRGMCMNVAKLDGGVAFNVIPDEATLTVSVRPPPGTDVEHVREQLYALALDVVPRAQLFVPMSNPSFHTRTPAAFAAALGAESPVDLAFWTEAALLAAAGIDCVVYGPGDIAHAHAPDEFVPIAELERARDTFAAVLAAEAVR
jgi:acetylornithine deacetylase